MQIGGSMKTFWIIISAVLTAMVGLFLNAPAAQTATMAAVETPAKLALAPSGPVVAELFTSQGCSSCPPADAVAARLARDPAILVVSRPVTYWDRLGWKDSLGREENTRLQHQYGDRAFDGANIFTPQLVIDGTSQGVGSQEGKVRALIARAARQRHDGRITVRIMGAGIDDRTIALTGPAGQKAEVLLVALSSSETVRIGRGENGGRTVHYTNVVVDEAVLGPWRGGNQSLTLPGSWLRVPGADRFAVIVRRGAGGPIIGSAVV